jgi:hypothetical protein
MCLLKFFYYYNWIKNIPNPIKKDINITWKYFEKEAGICSVCCKYTNELELKDKICYRCFEDKFYD